MISKRKRLRVGNLPRLREEGGWDNASLGIVLIFGSIGSLLALQIVGRLAGRIGTTHISFRRVVLAYKPASDIRSHRDQL